MSNLESRIHESYDRLNLDNTVYLLRNFADSYGQLPDPEKVTRVYKADVRQVDPEYKRGVYLLDWPDLYTKADHEQGGSIYTVSPREVFMLRELNTVITARTPLPKPRPSKLDRMIDSKSGRFREILAAEMARVVLERFVEDPRDAMGNLVKR
jgi:hypothetical protein